MCGGIYGRPRKYLTKGKNILSAGIILIDMIDTIDGIPTVDVVVNKDGKYTDPGGKFDPSKDNNIRMTAMREMKEETGIYTVITKKTIYIDYIDIHENGYRWYIVIRNKNISPVSMFKTEGDSEHKKISILDLINSKNISWRLQKALESQIKKKTYCSSKNLTLQNLLKYNSTKSC